MGVCVCGCMYVCVCVCVYVCVSHLQSLHNLFNVLHLALHDTDWHRLAPLVEDIQGRPALRPALRHSLPANHVAATAAEHYPARAAFDEHHRLGRDAQQARESEAVGLARLGGHHRPHQGTGAVELRALCPLHLVLALAAQRQQGELGGGVDGRGGDVVLRQVLKVLLARARGHGAELLGLLGAVLRVHHFGQQEVAEGWRLPETSAFGKQWTKQRDVLGAGHSHPEGKKR